MVSFVCIFTSVIYSTFILIFCIWILNIVFVFSCQNSMYSFFHRRPKTRSQRRRSFTFFPWCTSKSPLNKTSVCPEFLFIFNGWRTLLFHSFRVISLVDKHLFPKVWLYPVVCWMWFLYETNVTGGLDIWIYGSRLWGSTVTFRLDVHLTQSLRWPRRQRETVKVNACVSLLHIMPRQRYSSTGVNYTWICIFHPCKPSSFKPG